MAADRSRCRRRLGGPLRRIVCRSESQSRPCRPTNSRARRYAITGRTGLSTGHRPARRSARQFDVTSLQLASFGACWTSTVVGFGQFSVGFGHLNRFFRDEKRLATAQIRHGSGVFAAGIVVSQSVSPKKGRHSRHVNYRSIQQAESLNPVSFRNSRTLLTVSAVFRQTAGFAEFQSGVCHRYDVRATIPQTAEAVVLPPCRR